PGCPRIGLTTYTGGMCTARNAPFGIGSGKPIGGFGVETARRLRRVVGSAYPQPKIGRQGRREQPDVGYGNASSSHVPRMTQTNQPSTTKVEPMEPHDDDDALLTPSEVAAMFRVNPKTVTRWARAGKISAIRTLGGHPPFRGSEIRQFLEQVEQTDHL